MGVVYEAEDSKLGRRVALKFLPEDKPRDPHTIERFLREARSASALNHPGICTIYAIEEDAGKTFIAMELLEGRSLDKVMTAGPISFARTLEIGIQLADALDAAHKKGIIHRDIKPANIFLTERGMGKILDFGLAKLVATSSGVTEGPTISPDQTHLTTPGVAVGTIAVHVTGTGARRRTGRADRPVLAGCCALRDGDRPPRLSGINERDYF